MSLGQRIKERREHLEITIQELARHCGVSDKAVYQWEDGSTKGLRPENLVTTAELLKTYVRWLVRGVGPKEKVLSREQLTPREDNHIYTVRTLPEDMQEVVYDLAESLLKVERAKTRKAAK